MPMVLAGRRAAVAGAFVLCAAAALAQEPEPNADVPGAAPATRETPTPGGGNAAAAETQPAPFQPGFLSGLFSPARTNLLGDLYGFRTKLGDFGVTIGLQETSEVFGNAGGGFRRGAAYDGLTVMGLGVDTEKAFGWKGGTFNVTALQIHGRNLNLDNLGLLQNPSGIEALRSTRIWELWYQQAFLDGRFDIRIGQQSLDQEFITSQGSGLFLNAAMGYPVLAAADQYAGGPAYPLSSLGVRLRGQPVGPLTLLGGVFDDNPPGGPFANDSQVRGAAQSGTKFNLDTGALFIAEAQYAVNQPPASGAGEAAAPAGLPGLYKLGFWYDSGRFPDQRLDASGQLLASALSSGNPLSRPSNWSVYGVADQMVWKAAGEDPRAVSVFARAMGSPGDRNLVSFSLNTGVTVKAPIPGRDNDSFGIGYGLAKISPRAIERDQDAAALAGGSYPVRGSESFIEVTYQAQLAPWWLVQPDFQYVFTPAGGAPNPLAPGRRIGNEAIFGLRTNVTF